MAVDKIKKLYFTQETEDAIIKYNIITDTKERERLYREHIATAFDKLAEFLINNYKFYYAGANLYEIKIDVIEFLMEKLLKYEQGKGKAFSYFTIVARNFLIIQNRNNYKYKVQRRTIDSIAELEEFTYDQFENETEMKYDFFVKFIAYLRLNLERIFPKKIDYAIANAILEILEKRETLENFNKKALYIMIKEMTNVKSQQITKITNAYKVIFRKVYSDYATHGYIKMDKIYRG